MSVSVSKRQLASVSVSIGQFVYVSVNVPISGSTWQKVSLSVVSVSVSNRVLPTQNS